MTANPSRQELEARIVEQANTDPAFRQRLLDNPKEAIADFLGTALPPGMTITVLEEEPGQHYLVLPPAPPSLDAIPLDELELALVGGGRTLRPHLILCQAKNTGISETKTTTSSC
jgi:hypothetical protein